ncbi:MAG TPA: vitamin K epoxide reductase family protein [Polyangiaceae bacterium]|nr:vitamin K epoxide reductase family protein [Polyangiaceae bacterium]
MSAPNSKIPAAIALVGSLLGVLFATYSTLDYSNHLDRRLHDIHCSIIPGAPVTSAGDACRAAMYSPYSAILKERFWGGIPISLFAQGAFIFFVGFSLYLLLAGARAPKQALSFFGLIALTPLAASLTMLTISLVKLGSVCTTCAGIYTSSTLLALGALLGLRNLRAAASADGQQANMRPNVQSAERPQVPMLFPLAWLLALAVCTIVPARVYASSMPDHRPYLGTCGGLKNVREPKSLLHLHTAEPVQQATLFEDPLCPTCRAFHHRMLAENMFDKLNPTMVMFPLDSECNWMLEEPLHPGSCVVARAVLCAGDNARAVLEWAYDEQPALTEAGKSGKTAIEGMVGARWGDSILQCSRSKDAQKKLNEHLHYAVDNGIDLSTPQVFLDGKRFCDEDTDIGLRYTMAQLAPQVVK